MHLKYGLSAASIVTSVALVQFYSPMASALTAPEVSKIAKQITVRIEYEVGGRKKQGSGFIIKKEDNKYYVVTAYHVVAEKAKYNLFTPDGDSYTLDAEKMYHKSGTDLAVVEFASPKTYPIAKIGNSDSASEGTTVYVAGFPSKTSSVTSSQLYRFLEGKVSANASQPLDDGYSLVYTNPTLGGMSGGPVLNEQGEVVAIHGRAETQAQSSGDIVKAVTTGNNLGISVNTFLRLALLETGVKAPKLEVNDTPKADDFYLKGADLERKKDYRGAIEAYDRAIKINPKYAKAHFGKGFARIELQEYRQGIEDYTQAITLDPKNSLAYHNRGIGYMNLKDYPKAIADYTEAIKLDPKYAYAYYSRGYVKVELQEYRQGIEDYTQSIALNPKFAPAYHNRGIGYLNLKDYRQAIADYNQAIQLDPNYAQAYYSRGYVRVELQEYREGIADYTQSIALNPKYAPAHHNRGVAYSNLKDYRQAIRDYTEAIKLDPKYAQAYYSRGNAHFELQEYRQSIGDYTQIIKLDPKYTQAYYSRANAHFELQEYRQAKENYDRAISLNPSYADAYNNRGNTHKKLQDYRQAIADYDKSIAINPNLGNTYNNRGLARYEVQQVDEAIADWRKAMSFYPKWAAPQLALAVALYHQGDRQEGLKLAKEALSLDNRLRDRDFLENNWYWGDKILKDTAYMLKEGAL